MSDQIISRIDDMSARIDDLEHNINDLMSQAGDSFIEFFPNMFFMNIPYQNYYLQCVQKTINY